MRAMVIVGVLSGAVLLSGCGSDDDGDRASPTASPRTPPPASVAPQPDPGPAPADPALLAKGLTIDELPEGFGPDPAPPDPATLPSCVRDGLAVVEDTATARHDVRFRYSERGPYLTQTLGRFPEPPIAVVAAFRSCPGVLVQADPGLGDESHRFRLEGTPTSYDLTVLRVDDVTAVIVYRGAPGFDDSELSVLYRLAAEKLR